MVREELSPVRSTSPAGPPVAEGPNGALPAVSRATEAYPWQFRLGPLRRCQRRPSRSAAGAGGSGRPSRSAAGAVQTGAARGGGAAAGCGARGALRKRLCSFSGACARRRGATHLYKLRNLAVGEVYQFRGHRQALDEIIPLQNLVGRHDQEEPAPARACGQPAGSVRAWRARGWALGLARVVDPALCYLKEVWDSRLSRGPITEYRYLRTLVRVLRRVGRRQAARWNQGGFGGQEGIDAPASGVRFPQRETNLAFARFRHLRRAG
jgi:hypothetical protein